MALLAARVLAATLLEIDQLGAAALLEDFGGDAGACDRRLAERDVAVATQHQHFGELEQRARLGIELLDFEDFVGGDAVLLSARLDDSVHL